MQTRILLYEDNDHLRNSLSFLFQLQKVVVLAGTRSGTENILDDISTLKPDVILMDIDMPGQNGIEALGKIRKHYLDLPVIMLTVFDDQENIFNAICNGASGYILKRDIDQLIPAIRDVLNGGAPMTGSVARKVLGMFSGPRHKDAVTEKLFSERETELLQWLVKGFSYKMISDQMGISIETVRSHIKNIYKKLQVNSATEAIYKISREKLL